ncbi:MAG TPA: glycosyltransferase [Gemmatimonadales bacterium]
MIDAAALLSRLEWPLLAYAVALNTFYALLLACAIPEMVAHLRLSRGSRARRLVEGEGLPPISLLVPAYNEEVTIVASVQSFLTLEYPRHEVVLVNDGSTDGTLQRVMEAYDLYEVPHVVEATIPSRPVRACYRSRRFSRLLVVDKENGGKADSLNVALDAARYPYVSAVDSDTLVEPDALLRLARPFLLGTPVAAAAGTIRVVNACRVEHGRVVDARVDRRLLPGVQTVEYLRAFLFGRLGWNRLGGNLIISGAFGVFRREYLLAIGGYRTGSVTEDMDLVVRLRRYLAERRLPDRLPFIPDPVAWTEVPGRLKVLARQRERWHRGLLGALWSHRDLLCNPRYGTLGMVAFPFYLFGEALAPVVELVGWLVLAMGVLAGAVDWSFAGSFLLAAYGYGLLLSLAAIALDEWSFSRYSSRGDLLRLVGYAFVESFGYRQLTVCFRLHAFWRALRGDAGWGRMTREGFRDGPRPAPTLGAAAEVASQHG